MKKISLYLFCSIISMVTFGQMDSDNYSDELYLCVTVDESLSKTLYPVIKYYKVYNDSLYVFQKQYNHIPYEERAKLGTYTPKLPKLLECYSIKKPAWLELETIFEKTDSFGEHRVGLHHRDWAQSIFLIEGKYKGKEMKGGVNCYRKHIFVFIDWLNEVYPNGDVIDYNKQQLLKMEEAIKVEEQKYRQ